MGTKANSSDDSGGRSAVELGAWLVWPAIVATPLVAKRVLGSVSPNVGLVLGLVSVLQGMLAVVFYHMAGLAFEHSEVFLTTSRKERQRNLLQKGHSCKRNLLSKIQRWEINKAQI